LVASYGLDGELWDPSKTFFFLEGILPMILRGSPFADKHLGDDFGSMVIHPL
jgi:hypothetical protein